MRLTWYVHTVNLAVVMLTSIFDHPQFVGRFFIGLAAGSLSAATPLYNSEISAPELRGSLVSWQQFQICCGIAVSYWA